MRVNDARPNVAPRENPAVEQSAARLSSTQVGALFSGVELGWFQASSGACALLARAANALADLFAQEPASKSMAPKDSTNPAGSIVDFGDKDPANPRGSIVDFGDQGSDGLASIVDFGDGVDDVTG